MPFEELKAANGDVVNVDQDESCDILTVKFYDLDNATLTTAALQTVTMTLRNEADGTIINGKDGTDVLNDAGKLGVIADVGGEAVGRFRLQPADNPIVALTEPYEEKVEKHLCVLKWTWNDGVMTADRKNHHVYVIRVQPIKKA